MTVKLNPYFFAESILVLKQIREQIPSIRDELTEAIDQLADFGLRFCEAAAAATPDQYVRIENTDVMVKVCAFLITIFENGLTSDLQISCSPKLLPQLRLMQKLLGTEHVQTSAAAAVLASLRNQMPS